MLYESDFSLKDALQGLAETHFYLGEYRVRVLEYKYAKYFEDDKIRKEQRRREKLEATNENDDAIDDAKQVNDKGGDKWEEMKDQRETLAIYNHKKASTHFLKAAIDIAKAQREFNDN